MQRRNQMDSATQSGGSIPTSSQKRPRPSSAGARIRDVIDLRETSPAPASQPNKRAKQSDTLADADRPIKPYFQEDFVREALAKSKGVRPASPPEPSHISDPRVQKAPAIPTSRQVSQPINGSSNTVPSASQPQPTNLGGGSSSRTVVSDDHANSNSTGSSSSDGDIPLAATSNHSIRAFEASAEVLAAIFQMDVAVAKLKTAYEGEVRRMQAELVERDVLIDGLRARLRRKGSK
ncbi:general repressor of transcription [Pseudozyma hubeiensis SY62]|uniref:General repressor of transcription n=1 Tax=Pseudozyma hubeiensis (strain SY62) TaxID=1305764 RepID=R9P913_PSEHS|nr:general repressor of transcription [Pseudozyma hubeiensis SY62]GAC97863.1 general repressor of transcription [Pseudozyma hubeiensis SY62]